MVALRIENLKKGFYTGFSSQTRIFSTAVLSTAVFLLMVLSTDVPWHLETLERGLSYWDNAFLNGIASMQISGVYAVPLNVLYALLSGTVLTSFGASLSSGKLASKELGSILPGFVATGCASCGVGLAGIIGVAGVAATLPFEGTLVKAFGLLLLVYALHSFGKSDTCSIDGS